MGIPYNPLSTYVSHLFSVCPQIMRYEHFHLFCSLYLSLIHAGAALHEPHALGPVWVLALLALIQIDTERSGV